MKVNAYYQSKRNTLSFLMYFFLIIAVIISVFPFYWIFVGSTNSSIQITDGSLAFGKDLLLNWEHLRKAADVLRIFCNTFIITAVTTVLSILICAMAGYGFEKYRSKLKDMLYAMFPLSMMIPFAAQMIPLFSMINAFNLMNTKIAVILPSLALPFLIFFFRQSFVAFPTEIIEAARIDGASEFRIFFSVVLPSMRSTLAAAVIYAFMKQWNNYLWPLIVLQTNEQKTLTLLLSSLSSAFYVDYGQLMLAIVVSTLPIIVIFLTMQKQFVEGIVGSSK